jgi:hypothetical protein
MLQDLRIQTKSEHLPAIFIRRASEEIAIRHILLPYPQPSRGISIKIFIQFFTLLDCSLPANLNTGIAR